MGDAYEAMSMMSRESEGCARYEREKERLADAREDVERLRGALQWAIDALDGCGRTANRKQAAGGDHPGVSIMARSWLDDYARARAALNPSEPHEGDA